MKIIIILAILIIGYILFLEEGDLVEEVKQKTSDILVLTPGDSSLTNEEQIRSIIKSLPINENAMKAIKDRNDALEEINNLSGKKVEEKKEKYVRPRYDSLTLKGTIYGSKEARAMFVSPSGETIYAAVGDKIPSTDYILRRIDSNQVVVEKAGVYFILNIEK